MRAKHSDKSSLKSSVDRRSDRWRVSGGLEGVVYVCQSELLLLSDLGLEVGDRDMEDLTKGEMKQ